MVKTACQNAVKLSSLWVTALSLPLEILFLSNLATFIKVRVSFVFGLHTIKLIDFTRVFQLKGLKPKNKSHTNFYERCDLTEKVHLVYSPPSTNLLPPATLIFPAVLHPSLVMGQLTRIFKLLIKIWVITISQWEENLEK